MFTRSNMQGRFSVATRLLTTLVIMGLVAFVSPTTSKAANSASPQAAGVMQVHVTNYQHGNNLQGISVMAVNMLSPIIYTAQTGKDGIANLKVPAGTYQVTVRVLSTHELYEPWSQIVKVNTAITNGVEARILLSAEMYPLKISALDALSMGMVGNAQVRIYDYNGQTIAEGVTNKYGSFVTKAPEGVFMASVLHPKYEAHKDFVKIYSGQPNSTVVGLAALGAASLGDMQIHAIDAYSGALIQGASLTLYNANGKVIDQGMTDMSGTYYTCLPDGKYRVEVTAPKYMSYAGAYQITAGTLTHYKVLLVPFTGQ